MATATTNDVYLKFLPYNKEPYYVSLNKYINQHQDTYQDDREDELYRKEEGGYVPLNIVTPSEHAVEVSYSEDDPKSFGGALLAGINVSIT